MTVRRYFLAIVMGLCGLLPLTATAAVAAATKPQHVFVILLENKGYSRTFGPTPEAPYLGKTLPARGQLLTRYYGTGHASLDNYISLISGQAPNLITQSDCQIFLDFATVGAINGQALGQGCVYPKSVLTLADQLEQAGLSWRSYSEDMDDGVAHSCRHPQLNQLDGTQAATAGNQYAARHNPFVYFHRIIDHQPRCDAHVVDLKLLSRDLQQVRTTRNFNFITPDLCSDGHDTDCADGRPGGYASIDQFLRAWVPKILNSPAFKQDGLLVVTFDEADLENPTDPEAASACCGELAGPNTLLPGLYGPGGGRTGAVLISRFIKPGSINDTPYNHYSLLKSLEDLFDLPYLGYAGQKGLQAFGADVYR